MTTSGYFPSLCKQSRQVRLAPLKGRRNRCTDLPQRVTYPVQRCQTPLGVNRQTSKVKTRESIMTLVATLTPFQRQNPANSFLGPLAGY